MKDCRTLILGIGNEILKDDSIGLRLCDHLAVLNRHDNLIFRKVSLGGLELLDHIQDVDALLILDAIKTMDGQVGDIYLLEVSDFKQSSHISNVHNVDFITALETGRVLGMHLPPDIRIIAVEIEEDMEFGTELTPILASKYQEITKQVESLFKSFLERKSHSLISLS